MKTLAFFNNKGGVGKTTLVYHLAYMFAEQGVKVLAVDLDPQANLTSLCLEEERLETVCNSPHGTVHQAILPLLQGTGDIGVVKAEPIRAGLFLIPGDLALAAAEGDLASQWSECLNSNPRAFLMVSAIWRIIETAALDCDAELILLDLAPNLGAINRSALISCDNLVIPIVPDFFSLTGLKNLGPVIRGLRKEWQERLPRNPINQLSLPQGAMQPIGYVVLQHGLAPRRVVAYRQWMDQIPRAYRHSWLEQENATDEIQDDPNCLAYLKNYYSLVALSAQAHKPIFHLRPADGAIGAHVAAVQACYRDFHSLAKKIAVAVGVEMN